MLAQEAGATRLVHDAGSSAAAGKQRPAGRKLASLAAFAAAVTLVLTYALAGGAYDIVVRQEFGVVLWWVLGVGFVCGLLPRAKPARPTLIILGALLAYAVWTALSLGWTESSERTTAELARVLDYIGLVALVAALLDRGTWRAAAMGIGFAALLVCALAVASRLAPSAFPANPLGQVTSRLSYPFGYWNAVGAWAAMSTTIGLAWSAHDDSRIRRAVALGLVPVATLATYLSYSRAGVGGTVLGAAAVLALSRHRSTAFIHIAAAAAAAAIAILALRGAPEIAHGTGTSGVGSVIGALVLAIGIGSGTGILTAVGGLDRMRLPRRLVRSVAVAGTAAGLIAGVAFGPHLAKKAWHQFRHPAVVTTADPSSRLTQLSGTRYGVWKAALDAFTSHPITGIGAGSFEFWWNRQGTDSEFVRNAHSFEFENMAELGAPGLVFIAAVMAAALALLVAVRRRCRRSVSVGASTALLAAFLVYLLQASVDWLWQSTAVTVLVLAGAAAAGARLSMARPRIRWYGRAAVALVAAGAAAVQVPGLVSTEEVLRSQAAERAGNAPLALSWANAAVGAEPWAASAYEQRGLVLESAGRLGPAAQDLSRAISHERTNFRHWLLLARIETERGLIATAERDYNQARSLRPKALVFAFAPYFSTTRP